MARVRLHRRPTAAELASDRDALDLVAFDRMLAVQAACDLAAHSIADEGFTAPATAAESFQRLADHQVLTASTALGLRKAVGLRDIVAHGYAGIDAAATHAAATGGLDDLESVFPQGRHVAHRSIHLTTTRPVATPPLQGPRLHDKTTCNRAVVRRNGAYPRAFVKRA